MKTESGNADYLFKRVFLLNDNIGRSANMSSFKPERKSFIVEALFRNNNSYNTAIRKYEKEFKLRPRDKVPDRKTVNRWSVLKKKPPERTSSKNSYEDRRSS